MSEDLYLAGHTMLSCPSHHYFSVTPRLPSLASRGLNAHRTGARRRTATQPFECNKQQRITWLPPVQGICAACTWGWVVGPLNTVTPISSLWTGHPLSTQLRPLPGISPVDWTATQCRKNGTIHFCQSQLQAVLECQDDRSLYHNTIREGPGCRGDWSYCHDNWAYPNLH